MKVGDKVKISHDIPSADGMLYKNTVVKIDFIDEKALKEVKPEYRDIISMRVTDDLGKIWRVLLEDVKKL